MSTAQRALTVRGQRQSEEVKLELAKDTISLEQSGHIFHMLRNCNLQQVVDLWYANVLHPNIHNSALFRQELERRASGSRTTLSRLNEELVEEDDEDSTEYNRWWLRTFEPDSVLFFADSLKEKYDPQRNPVFARWLRYRLERSSWPQWLEASATDRERTTPKADLSGCIEEQGVLVASERPSKRLKRSN